MNLRVSEYRVLGQFTAHTANSNCDGSHIQASDSG